MADLRMRWSHQPLGSCIDASGVDHKDQERHSSGGFAAGLRNEAPRSTPAIPQQAFSNAYAEPSPGHGTAKPTQPTWSQTTQPA
eukprot:2992982-Prorocentrum_lima.AAC.1